MIKIEILLLQEHEVHSLMEKADLTENGRKVFCCSDISIPNAIAIRYEIDGESGMEDSISDILNLKEYNGARNPINPVFALAIADNGYVGVYWRPKVNQISDGIRWTMYHKYVELHLNCYCPDAKISLNDNMSIKSIFIKRNDKVIEISNLNKNI